MPIVLVLLLIFSCNGKDNPSDENKSDETEASKPISHVKITGKIYSLPDSSLISGAMIIRTGTTDGTITDPEGKFIISVPEQDSVNITFAAQGYLTRKLKVSTGEEQKIYLEPEEKGD